MFNGVLSVIYVSDGQLGRLHRLDQIPPGLSCTIHINVGISSGHNAFVENLFTHLTHTT